MTRFLAFLLILTAAFACGADISAPDDPADALAARDDRGEFWGVSDFDRDLIEAAVEHYLRQRGLPPVERTAIVHLEEFDDGMHYQATAGAFQLRVVLDPDAEVVISVSELSAASAQADQ